MTRRLLAALLLAAPVLARADGLAFQGDLPQFRHVWLQLEAKQAAALDAAPNARAATPATVELTAAQQETLRREAGATASWLFVIDRTDSPSLVDRTDSPRLVDRSAAASSCTCGVYNLAVRVGPWLAVYADALGEYPSPDEVIRASRGRADPALAFAAPAREPEVRAAPAGVAPPLLARVQDLLPGGRFARYLPTTGGWQAVTVRHAPLADFVEDLADAALSLTAERELSAHATGASSAAWPDSGARRVLPDGTTVYAIPYVLQGEAPPPVRAWLVLAYRDGLLAEHALVTEPGGLAGATYAWAE
jgi:hypothetical protein